MTNTPCNQIIADSLFIRINRFVIKLVFLFIVFGFNTSYAQRSAISDILRSSLWDSMFPQRAGTFGTHPQGYTSDFYSYSNLKQAADEMSDYFVIIRTKSGVWGQLITITRKSSLKTFVYSDVDSWWHTNSTPETMVVVDFENFLNESSQAANKRELAAFLAHISKETTGGWQLPVGGGSGGDYAKWGLYFVHEVGYTPTNSAGTYSQSHSEFPPNPKVGYYGRGPIQLSWNYNYGQFSKFIYHDKNILLDYPDSLKENGVLAFKSAIWFWMMPQCPKPSCHQVMHDQWLHDSAYSASRMYKKGFAHTNNIINGGLECRTYSSGAFTQKVELRSALYKYYMKVMGFTSGQIAAEDSGDYSTFCFSSSTDAMTDYAGCKVNNGYYGSFAVDTQKACGSLVWIDGKTYTQSTKTALHKVKGGDRNKNDSLVWLNLTILPVTIGTELQTACDSFKWRDGKTYTVSTDTPLFTLKGGSMNGCDSIIRLNLTVLHPSVMIDSQIACDSFRWRNDMTYTESTDSPEYRIKGGAANGCDSVIRLRLTISKPTRSEDFQSACSVFKWIDGKTYTENTDSAEYRILGGAANGCDSIITLHLKILQPSLGIDSQTACNKFTWINNVTYTSNTDTVTHLLPGAASNGCDSIVTLDLNIINVNTGINQNGNILTAESTEGTFQWGECREGFIPLAGETMRTFTAKQDGDYAVALFQNGCYDTSECIAVDVLGVSRLNPNSNVSVYPNPNSGSFLIEHTEIIDRIEIYNSLGMCIFSRICDSEKVRVDLSGQSAGNYFIKVIAGDVQSIHTVRVHSH